MGDLKKFIFDVDGTLTPSRGKIDPDFLQFMLYFAGINDVYLVTGSDRDKTLEQVGLDSLRLERLERFFCTILRRFILYYIIRNYICVHNIKK